MTLTSAISVPLAGTAVAMPTSCGQRPDGGTMMVRDSLCAAVCGVFITACGGSPHILPPDPKPDGGVQVPAAPSNLIASAVANDQVQLTWTVNSSDQTGFAVQS